MRPSPLSPEEQERLRRFNTMPGFQQLASVFPIGRQPTGLIGVMVLVEYRLPGGQIERRTLGENIRGLTSIDDVNRRMRILAEQLAARGTFGLARDDEQGIQGASVVSIRVTRIFDRPWYALPR